LIRQRMVCERRKFPGVNRFTTSGDTRNTSEIAIVPRQIERGRALLCCVAVTVLVLLSACERPQTAPAPGGEWHDFAGTWTAAGSRNIMRMGNDRQAAISTLDGSLVLTGSKGVGVGFRSQAVIFNDSATGMVGRAVWTDEHGEQVFSELRGEGTAADNKISGTFVGGTGRYQGANGTYSFSWRFVIENEDGVVQGQSLGLNGRVRVGLPQTESGTGGTHS
jgi:hypothetical protein